jgi:uncharacterized membrane protein
VSWLHADGRALASAPRRDQRAPGLAAPAQQGPGGIQRFEEDTFEAVGSWSRVSSSAASGGYYLRTLYPGGVLSQTVSGQWIGLGFIGDKYSGLVHVQVDDGAIVSETIDLYRRETSSVSRYYSLLSGAHIVAITVLDRPSSTRDRVYADFTWEGRDGGGARNGPKVSVLPFSKGASLPER